MWKAARKRKSCPHLTSSWSSFFKKKESEKRILAAFPICLIPDQCEILTDVITQTLYKHGKINWVWKVQKVEIIEINLKKKKRKERNFSA